MPKVGPNIPESIEAQEKAAKGRLNELLHNFHEDRDEDWMLYLESKDQSYLRNLRRQYFHINENMDWARADHKRVLQNPSMSAIEKDTASKEVAKRIRKFRQRRIDMIDANLPKVRFLLAKGQRLMQEKLDEVLNPKPKRQKIQPSEDVEIEFYTDDYMPRLSQDQATSSSSSNRVNQSDAESINHNEPEARKSKTRDKPDSRGRTDNVGLRDRLPKELSIPTSDAYDIPSLIEGVTPRDAEILIHLKAAIAKHNCREALLKALASYRSLQGTLQALDAFAQDITEYKKRKMAKTKKMKMDPDEP